MENHFVINSSTSVIQTQTAEISDTELLARICANDKEATAIIFNRYARKLKAYAMRLCGAKDADDIVQETFLKLIVNPPIMLNYDSLAPWLFKVARNLFLDKVRKDKRIVDTELPEPCDEHSPRHLAMIHNDVANAKQLLAQLPQEYREVMELYAVAELSVKDIAATLDTPLGTVLWRMYKARKLLEAGKSRL